MKLLTLLANGKIVEENSCYIANQKTASVVNTQQLSVKA